MSYNGSFTAATEEYIVSKIRKAKYRVAFVGSGFSAKIAKEIACKADIVENIIFDNDTDVYKIGYGNAESLNILKNAEIPLKEAHNVRINVFAFDDEALIYSPTPEIIENPNRDSYPNGIIVKYTAISGVFDVFETKAQQFQKQKGLKMCKKDYEGDADSSKLVVTELTNKSINETLQFVSKNPPKLDLHRTLNAYNAKIKFIEIQLSGFNIKQHKVKIPSELLVIAKDNATVQNQLSATYSLFNTFNEENELIKATTNIQSLVKKLRDKYTLNLPGYGTMCLVSKITDIEKDIQDIQLQIEKSKAKIYSKINSEIEKSKKALSKALTPLVQKNPPEILRDNLFDSKRVTVKMAKMFVDDQLDQAFITGENYLQDMKLEVRYKDLTLETLEKEEVVARIMNSKWRYNFADENILTYERGLAEIQ